MSRSARLWLLVVPPAAVVGTAATALILTSDHLQASRPPGAWSPPLTGGSFIAAGLVARTRRPANRTGLLLIAVGFTWFMSTGLMASDDSIRLDDRSSRSAPIPAGFLIHLLIAYPSGRLQSRARSASSS